MYRSPLRCSTSSDSKTHGCAPGASPGGDTTTPYDNDGYTAACVHCALGLFGNDGTCAGCPTGSAGSQVARCVPGGTNPATIPACAVPSLVSPATYADKDDNEAACESVVGLAHEPETCTVHSSKERRRPLFWQPFWTVTGPVPGLVVPLAGFLASRRRKQRKDGEKMRKNGRDTAI